MLPDYLSQEHGFRIGNAVTHTAPQLRYFIRRNLDSIGNIDKQKQTFISFRKPWRWQQATDGKRSAAWGGRFGTAVPDSVGNIYGGLRTLSGKPTLFMESSCPLGSPNYRRRCQEFQCTVVIVSSSPRLLPELCN